MTDYTLDELKWLAEFAGVAVAGDTINRSETHISFWSRPLLWMNDYWSPLDLEVGLRLLSTLVLDCERWLSGWSVGKIPSFYGDGSAGIAVMDDAAQGMDSLLVSPVFHEAHHAILRAALTLRE